MCVHVCKHTHTHIIHNSAVQLDCRHKNYFHQSFDPLKVPGLFSLKSSYTVSKYFTHWIKPWYLKACITKISSTDFNSLLNLTLPNCPHNGIALELNDVKSSIALFLDCLYVFKKHINIFNK